MQLALTCCLTYFAIRRIVRRERHEVKRQISMTTRKELVAALQLRYGSAAFVDFLSGLNPGDSSSERLKSQAGNVPGRVCVAVV